MMQDWAASLTGKRAQSDNVIDLDHRNQETSEALGAAK